MMEYQCSLHAGFKVTLQSVALAKLARICPHLNSKVSEFPWEVVLPFLVVSYPMLGTSQILGSAVSTAGKSPLDCHFDNACSWMPDPRDSTAKWQIESGAMCLRPLILPQHFESLSDLGSSHNGWRAQLWSADVHFLHNVQCLIFVYSLSPTLVDAISLSVLLHSSGRPVALWNSSESRCPSSSWNSALIDLGTGSSADFKWNWGFQGETVLRLFFSLRSTSLFLQDVFLTLRSFPLFCQQLDEDGRCQLAANSLLIETLIGPIEFILNSSNFPLAFLLSMLLFSLLIFLFSFTSTQSLRSSCSPANPKAFKLLLQPTALEHYRFNVNLAESQNRFDLSSEERFSGIRPSSTTFSKNNRCVQVPDPKTGKLASLCFNDDLWNTSGPTSGWQSTKVDLTSAAKTDFQVFSVASPLDGIVQPNKSSNCEPEVLWSTNSTSVISTWAEAVVSLESDKSVAKVTVFKLSIRKQENLQVSGGLSTIFSNCKKLSDPETGELHTICFNDDRWNATGTTSDWQDAKGDLTSLVESDFQLVKLTELLAALFYCAPDSLSLYPMERTFSYFDIDDRVVVVIYLSHACVPVLHPITGKLSSVCSNDDLWNVTGPTSGWQMAKIDLTSAGKSDFQIILEGVIPAGHPDARICVDNITSYTVPCSGALLLIYFDLT
ncbi:unnamed protein product [Hydatigera taeniaeformis]|uniref:MAM domain-containing protein n=1 Tax=Hydatigena taeniaeformis TaxID=6205 RepID=A0A0R3WLT5_HYDTA|nr:unnamed protein product [Hydatigera taeniaeformis]